ncbi:MAG: glycosyltransferase family 4 protein [Paenibacillus sp.]|nr:glycosyltransferase family 4 protein [Paenibacillus sp.]
MKNILIISPAAIKKNMSGPSIRYWEISKELSKSNNIILLVPNEDFLENKDFTIMKITISNLIKSLKKCDAVLLQGLTLWKYPFIKYFNKAIAVDLYDPFHLENLEGLSNTISSKIKHFTTLAVIKEQLIRGDYFYCASEKQKDYWLGMLSSQKITPSLYNSIDRNIANLIGIVPFGIPEYSPTKQNRVLKGMYSTIGETDKVVVWGGGIWDWLDPETLIKAMAIVKEERTDVKCFFMGVKPPVGSEPKKLKSLLKLRKDLKLEDTVVFNDWVEYEKRSDFLLEADIGISLHESHLETRFSYRTRLLDYIWCKLPIIASDGDVFSEIIKKNNLGTVVKPKDEIETANHIIRMVIEEKGNYYTDHNSSKFSWSSAVKDLLQFCKNPKRISVRFSFLIELQLFFWRVIYLSIRMHKKMFK